MVSAYPDKDRNSWIVAQRPARSRAVDLEKPHGVFLEEERLRSGEVVSSGVILLVNKECPWRCLMCDLWKEMSSEKVPLGAIPKQIAFAVAQWATLGALPRQVKLYNSGSFFDPQAIPVEDYNIIADQLDFAENVIVESHPALIGERTLRLRDLSKGSLEVAMGLETAKPDVLEKLNKKFDLSRFEEAAQFLKQAGVALRVFVLVRPPFMSEAEGVEWAVKSAAFAFSGGATAVSLIPTRPGNGAMEKLQASGEFTPPTLRSLEDALSAALALGRGRVFADTWGLEIFSNCERCFPARVERLGQMNLTQKYRPRIQCDCIEGRDA